MQKKLIVLRNGFPRELSQLIETGVKLGDQIEFSPIYHAKRKLHLGRTKYIFSSSLVEESRCSIKLDHFKHQNLEFSLELHSFYEEQSGREENSRYKLKSNCELPFRLNGNYCFEAFIERGDIVHLGQNQLVFKSMERALSLDGLGADHPILLKRHLIQSELSILIEGKTGTGKSYLASKIHEQSNKRGEFVHLNLSSFSPSLIESELFGHVKGAYTGAISDKKGAIAQAQNGTLFIDEIDSLPYYLQSKLLIFLDNGKIRPVGGTKDQKVRTRLIFASGRSLKEMVDKGQFREDLYYRLSSGLNIKLPLLRDQPEKIKSLIMHYGLEHNINFTSRVLEFYMSYLWPGNIRQLLSHLNCKRVLCTKNKIDLDQYDWELMEGQTDHSLNEQFLSIKELKRSYAKKVYYKCDKNINEAVRILNITPKTFKTLIS